MNIGAHLLDFEVRCAGNGESLSRVSNTQQ